MPNLKLDIFSPLGPQRADVSGHPPQAPQLKPKVPMTCGHQNELSQVLGGPGLNIGLYVNPFSTPRGQRGRINEVLRPQNYPVGRYRQITPEDFFP